MQNFTKTQKITILAMILFMVFNPMSYQVLKDYIEWGFNIVALLAGAWCVGFLLYKTLKPEKVNIPKKNKKSVVKSKQYIDE